MLIGQHVYLQVADLRLDPGVPPGFLRPPVGLGCPGFQVVQVTLKKDRNLSAAALDPIVQPSISFCVGLPLPGPARFGNVKATPPAVFLDIDLPPFVFLDPFGGICPSSHCFLILLSDIIREQNRLVEKFFCPLPLLVLQHREGLFFCPVVYLGYASLLSKASMAIASSWAILMPCSSL